MMLLVYLAILILAIIFPKSKKVSFIALAFMFVMYCFVFYEGDLEIYKWIYEDYGVGLSSTSFEPGFTLLIILCKKLGMSFFGYRIVLGLLFLSLLYRGVSDLTEYRALALTLSALFPFFIFTSVLRSGLACVVILNGFKYLINPAYGKRGIVRYALLVLLAASLHYSSALMIAFVFARMRINPGRMMKYLVAVILLTVLLNQTNIIFRVLSHLTTREKILQWFVRGEGTANMTGTIAIVILLVMNCFFAKRSRVLLSRPEGGLDFFKRESQFVFNSSLLLFLFFPLMVFASPFMRVAYMLMPLYIANGVNAAFFPSSNNRLGAPLGRSVSLQFVFLVASLLVWKLYYDLPYIKSGTIPFQDLLRTQFWLG